MSLFDLYGIKEKVLSLIFDNVSTNTTAINLFNQTLKLPHGGQLFHQRYVSHISNLVVQDDFKQFQLYLNNIRDAVGFIYGSGTNIQEFEQARHHFGLPLKKLPTDMPNR